VTSRFGITRRLSTFVSDISGSFSRQPPRPQTRNALPPFPTTRPRNRGGGRSFEGQVSRRTAPYLSPSGPVHSPYQSMNKAALKSAPSRGLDWAELFKNRSLLQRRWLDGEQYTMVLQGHTDSVYCIQADRNIVVSGSVGSFYSSDQS
jgi:hypothetical protein